MATTLSNTIEIRCTPEALYRYVTQPWRWHEWHPNSKSASSTGDTLGIGDHFNEEIELQPFSPLPFRMRRRTSYEVLVAEPFRSWEVRGETRDGWLRIRYEFERCHAGTAFTRTLTYSTRGPSKLLMPFLKGRMAGNSLAALRNLKNRLELNTNP
jgi:hypothetical protein